MRKLLSAVFILGAAVAVYNLYLSATWTPTRFSLRALRAAIGMGDKINADQIRDESGEYLDEAKEARRIDIGELRERILPGARRAGELKQLHEEAVAQVNGITLPREERIVPPPPPKPVKPLYDVIPAYQVVNGEQYVTAGGWHSFARTRSSVWSGTVFERIEFHGPLGFRASGHVTVLNRTADPEGLNQWPDAEAENSRYYEAIAPDLPYLGLLGRICRSHDGIQEQTSIWNGLVDKTNLSCTAPFVLGRSAVLCPDQIGMTGELQVMINTRYKMFGNGDGGGFYIETFEVPSNACRGGQNLRDLHAETQAIAENRAYRLAEKRVLATQVDWKPIWIRVNKPLLITATGQLQEHEQSENITGPAGGETPKDMSRFRLHDESFPYRALLGRVCNGNQCSRPFLVGNSARLCPGETVGDRLEFRYNDFTHFKGGNALDQPGRAGLGAYRFEVKDAPAGSCS